MKIIFLDIDGVLCVPGRKTFDPSCVDKLNRITANSGAKLVISSTWRLSCKNVKDFGALTAYLHSQGIKADIIGLTPSHGTVDNVRGANGRGAEIKEWLDTTGIKLGVSEFVIIDDNGDMGELIDSLVLTSHKTGLIEKNIDASLKVLGCANE